MCTTHLYGKSYAHKSKFKEKLCTQVVVSEKIYTQVVVSEKIYTQVILKVVMHTNCTHKFCSNQTLCLKII
jgi:hypothetical protein